MSNFMMNVVSWVLLLLVILTLYLIDKVNQLAKMYENPANAQPATEAPVEPAPPGDILFSGLEGKKLWDAMNGKQVDGFDANLVEALRPHYEPILRAHITATFQDGVEDAAGIENRVPNSERQISTARGHIQSWLPPQHLGSIYRNAREYGGDYAKNPDPDVLARLKQTIDSVVDMMYQRVGIPNDTPYSQFLFKRPAPSADASDDNVLALTDQTGQAEVLEGGNALNQGLEHVQAYEDQQRQDLATDTVTDVPFNQPVTADAKIA
ncbi:hypothetical protein [Limnohabitans sp.]|jgi:hypothetical protein|uniref:hypothetical protein n=1 Tax=Limnohabitans sp. TaxID=1907725 RepID=UPI00286F9CFB|nr:hypothetical protein [Limnohabitans sp.]